MSSSDFEIPAFFLHLQIHLSRWCFTQHVYSTSTLLLAHVCFEFFIAKGADRSRFTAFKSECQLESSQRCLLSYGTYLVLFHIHTGSMNGSALLYIVVQHSTPAV